MGWRPLVDYLSQTIPMARSLVPRYCRFRNRVIIMGIGVYGLCGARASAHCSLSERYAQTNLSSSVLGQVTLVF